MTVLFYTMESDCLGSERKNEHFLPIHQLTDLHSNPRDPDWVASRLSLPLGDSTRASTQGSCLLHMLIPPDTAQGGT